MVYLGEEYSGILCTILETSLRLKLHQHLKIATKKTSGTEMRLGITGIIWCLMGYRNRSSSSQQATRSMKDHQKSD